MNSVLNSLLVQSCTFPLRSLAFSAPQRYLFPSSLPLLRLQQESKTPPHYRLQIFTEQVILAELLAQHIEARTGVHVDRKSNLGGTLLCKKASSPAISTCTWNTPALH